MQYRKSTFIIALLFCFWQINAQNNTIKGKVIDEKGIALIGATIKANATTGVVTDINGAYELFLPKGNYSLECSYVGYETQIKKITLEDNQNIDFQLIAAQNILNQLTVTSGRYEKPLGEVTVSMEVLKPDLIQRNNGQSMDNILQKVPGMTIVGGQPNIRGGSGFSYGAGSRVLIMVDDIPALQADAGSPNWNDFQVETIEQIEVLKGAASSLYGSSALNGVVNIRTAYAKDKPITTFSTFYTYYDDPKDKNQIWYKKQPYETGFSATHRQKFKKLDVVLGTNWRVLQSFSEATYDSVGRVTIGTRYRINDRLYVGVNSNINFGSSKYYFYWKDGKEGAFQATQSTITDSRKLRYTIDPFLSYFDKKGNQHKLLGRFYDIKNNVTGGNQNASKLFYGEYQFQRKWDNGWVMTNGLVASGTFVKAQLYGDTTYRSTNLAAYTQVEKKIKRLTLSAGARYEYNRLKTPNYVKISPFSPKYDTIPNGLTKEAKPVFRFGANYQLAKYTYLRGSFGQGYRYPTIAEKFITSNLSAVLIIPNAKLQSETGWSSEIGIKQGTKIGNWYGFVDVAGFWTEYRNMMEFIFTFPSFQSQNIGDTRIRGIETTIAGAGKIGDVELSLLGGYTYIDPQYKHFTDKEKQLNSVDYNVLKYRFRHTAKIDAEATYKRFSVGFAVNYLSKMEAIDKIFEFAIPGVKDFRAVHNTNKTITDLRASYTLLKYYKLSFLVKNIANTLYTTRPALLEAPRNYNIRLDVKF